MHLTPHENIALFVKDIMVFRDETATARTALSFYADGYPGIMFQQTENGLYVLPHNKKMPSLFLYGQTIQPVELVIEGNYKLVCFQLYPFVVNSFFNLKAKDINDDCYDLIKLEGFDVTKTINLLNNEPRVEKHVELIADLLWRIFETRRGALDYKIQQAIQLIINNNGNLNINALIELLKINERTFERRFITQVGISPKQFSRIIQFQSSLNQLTDKDYNKLTDIVYNNGFADQSHFIRVLKPSPERLPGTLQHSISRLYWSGLFYFSAPNIFIFVV